MTTERDEVVVTILTSNSSRDELIEAITLVNHEAKRAPCVIGTAEHPSRWDVLTAFSNDLLDELAGR